MPKDTNPATKPYPPPPPPQLNDGVRGRQVQQRDRQIARASAPNYPPSYGSGGYFNGPPGNGGYMPPAHTPMSLNVVSIFLMRCYLGLVLTDNLPIIQSL